MVFSFWLLEDGRVEPDRHHCWYWIAACRFCLESIIVDAHRHHSTNNNSRLKWFSNVWFRFCSIKHTRLPSYSAWLLLFLLKLLISFWREDSSPMTNLARFIVANQWIFGFIVVDEFVGTYSINFHIFSSFLRWQTIIVNDWIVHIDRPVFKLSSFFPLPWFPKVPLCQKSDDWSFSALSFKIVSSNLKWANSLVASIDYFFAKIVH